MRPVAGIGKFVPGRSPGLHLRPEVFWNARVSGEEIDEAADIILVLLLNFFPFSIVALRIVVIGADEIGREPAIIVDVGFVIGHANKMPELIVLWFVAGGEQRFQHAL